MKMKTEKYVAEGKQTVFDEANQIISNSSLLGPGTLFSHVLKNKRQKNEFTKLNPKKIVSPHQDLSNSGRCSQPLRLFGN